MCSVKKMNKTRTKQLRDARWRRHTLPFSEEDSPPRDVRIDFRETASDVVDVGGPDDGASEVPASGWLARLVLTFRGLWR